MKDIFESLEKKEVYLTILAIIILAFSFYQADLIKDFKQIPACLYGCDLYNHVGKIYHLYDGGSFFRDGANPGVNPWVPSLHHAMIALFAKLTGFDVMHAFNFFTIIAGILCIVVTFFLFRLLFGNSLFGFLGVLLFLPQFPVWKYTPFTAAVMIPLFFLSFLYFFKKRTILSAVFVGLSFGAVSLTSSNGFLTVVFFVAVAFFFMIIPELLKLRHEHKKLKHHAIHILKSYVLPFGIITLVGMSLAMLYWYEPIFRFHLHMTNLQSDFDAPDMSQPSIFMNSIYSLIGNFFTFADLPTFILMAASLLGILLLFLVKGSKEGSKDQSPPSHFSSRNFIVMSLLAVIIGGFNFIILYPLLKLDLLSGWIFYLLYTTVKVMLVLFCIFLVYNIMQKKKKMASILFNITIIVIIIAISLAGIIASYNTHKNSSFEQNAKNDLDPLRKDIQTWVRSNTNVNDIFLTTNENSFALNAITGRKMMTMRRSHSNQFLDFNQIMMDAAVILYGNNSQVTKDLLKKYDVKYFYWDYYWFNSEFQFDDKGQLVGFFDPLVTTDTKEHRQFLDENNVRYVAKHWYLDPGVQYEGIKQYDLLFVLPQQFNQTKPWSDTFGNLITIQKDFNYDGTSYAKIYRITTD